MSSFKNNNNSGKVARKFRLMLHLVMGIVYVVLAVIVINMKHFGTMELDKGMAYALGGLLALYGIFRIWRGLQERHREND
jgi:uncharacterized membrane protein HdeD (DUF308 family)